MFLGADEIPENNPRSGRFAVCAETTAKPSGRHACFVVYWVSKQRCGRVVVPFVAGGARTPEVHTRWIRFGWLGKTVFYGIIIDPGFRAVFPDAPPRHSRRRIRVSQKYLSFISKTYEKKSDKTVLMHV